MRLGTRFEVHLPGDGLSCLLCPGAQPPLLGRKRGRDFGSQAFGALDPSLVSFLVATCLAQPRSSTPFPHAELTCQKVVPGVSLVPFGGQTGSHRHER